MPLHYGSQVAEHDCVRMTCGVFDVSHMGIVDITGRDAYPLLRYALANDIAKLASPCQALYSCMLNHQGGIIDDLIVYHLATEQYRIVWNAGRRAIDLAWLTKLATDFNVMITERDDLAILAIQGPNTFAHLPTLFTPDICDTIFALKPFTATRDHSTWIARTGYTGEAGVEIMLPANEVADFWQHCMDDNIQPVGLGARDTLRLEAGFNLYGTDMDETTTPWVSNLGWTVSLKDTERDFVGKAALLQQKSDGIRFKLAGISMTERGVLRNHDIVHFNSGQQGVITSGSFSPTLGHAIGLARIPIDAKEGAFIERRGKHIPVMITHPCFVKHGSTAL